MSAIETREALERAITWVDERPNGTSLRVGCEPPHDKPVTRAEVRMTLRALLDSLAAPPVPEDVALALTLIRHGAWQGLGCVTCPKEAECDGDRMLCDDALATITTALHSLTAEVERLRGERDAARQAACIMCQRQGEAPERCDEIECAARTPERT